MVLVQQYNIVHVQGPIIIKKEGMQQLQLASKY